MAVSVQFQDLIAGGGVAIRAAALVAADGADTGVFVGKGWMIIDLVWTACEIATGDEFYNVQFQFNTQAAASTWLDDINIAFGNAALLGGAAATAAAGEMIFAIHNPYDHQVRTNNWVTGTIATGFNYAATAYPMKLGDF
jgi:hypothetical protein